MSFSELKSRVRVISVSAYEACLMQELVFNHVFKKLKDHVFEDFRLLELGSEHFLKLAEAFVIEVLHVIEPVSLCLAM